MFPEKKAKIEKYFGLTRTAYLQHLANRYGDFKISWQFKSTKENDGELIFYHTSVLDIWHKNPRMLDMAQHRRKMPHETFVEIDDVGLIAEKKRLQVVRACNAKNWQYAVFKSRKGYHISVLSKERVADSLITEYECDTQMLSPKAQWCLEWTKHWKDTRFELFLVEISERYITEFLGSDY